MSIIPFITHTQKIDSNIINSSLKFKPKKIYTHKGIGLIEALVSMVVFMIGLVGVLKLLNISVNSTQSSETQGAIAILVEDASERLILLANDSNQVGMNAFLDASECTSITDTIKLTQCQNGLQQRKEWDINLLRSIPNAKSSITRTGDNNSIEIKISWKEKVAGNTNKQTNNTFMDRTHKAMLDF
jgi:Tfp pilus assembly protein PilV